MPKDQIHTLLSLRYNYSSQVHKPKKCIKDQKIQKVQKFQIKAPKGTRDYYPNQMAVRRKVIDQIVSIFKKHGGVEIDTPVFQLRQVLTGKYGQDSKLIYNLQDQGGQLCSLRYDLTVPFARFMANNTNIQKIKRFHIGKVYRRDQPTLNKGRYRQFYQCDFDIAGKYDPMIPDAQVLAIMQEILQQLGVNNYLVKVNHRKILQCMVAQAGCDIALFKPICSAIDKLDKASWQEVKKQLLQKGITQEQANILGQLTKYKGQPQILLKKLIQTNIFKKTQNQLKQIYQNMQKLFIYLKSMKRIQKISFDLSLARGLDYYTGIIYQIVLTDKNNQLGSISGGGRYDNLIGMFCQYQIPSVGGSIGIQRLFTILQKQYINKIKQNQCQMLVATIGKISVQDKMAILAKLWAKNIKAQTLYVQKSKTDKQINHAFTNGIPIILWIGQQQFKNGQLKLKILYKHQQVIINANNLQNQAIKYVQQFRIDYANGQVNLQDPQKKK